MTVAVVGASGRVGGRAVELLAAAGVPVRAVVRDPGAVPGRWSVGGVTPEVVAGRPDDPDGMRAALDGVDGLLLAIAAEDMVGAETAVIDAAVAAGVGHIVKLSGYGAGPDCPIPRGVLHFEIEEHLRATGVQATVLRPTIFLVNLLGAAPAIAAGVLPAAAGTARAAWVDPGDVAAVAARLVADPSHGGGTYVLTGPDSLTYDELAALLSAGVGHPVVYRDVDDAAFRALLGRGPMPAWEADHVAVMHSAAIRQGYFDIHTDEVERITGRPPTSVAEWINRNADRLAGPR